MALSHVRPQPTPFLPPRMDSRTRVYTTHTCMHVHLYARTPHVHTPHTYAYPHMYTHECICTRLCVCCPRAHTCTCMYAHPTCMYTCPHMYTAHMNTPPYTCTHTAACTHVWLLCGVTFLKVTSHDIPSCSRSGSRPLTFHLSARAQCGWCERALMGDVACFWSSLQDSGPFRHSQPPNTQHY